MYINSLDYENNIVMNELDNLYVVIWMIYMICIFVKMLLCDWIWYEVVYSYWDVKYVCKNDELWINGMWC